MHYVLRISSTKQRPCSQPIFAQRQNEFIYSHMVAGRIQTPRSSQREEHRERVSLPRRSRALHLSDVGASQFVPGQATHIGHFKVWLVQLVDYVYLVVPGPLSISPVACHISASTFPAFYRARPAARSRNGTRSWSSTPSSSSTSASDFGPWASCSGASG